MKWVSRTTGAVVDETTYQVFGTKGGESRGSFDRLQGEVAKRRREREKIGGCVAMTAGRQWKGLATKKDGLTNG